MACAPSNGGRPATHSNSTQPSENTSARASVERSARACSGAMYCGVPSTVPVTVADRSEPRATPKSSTPRVTSDEEDVRRFDVAMHDAA